MPCHPGIEDEFIDWFRGKSGLLEQAKRQAAAGKATGTPVEWHVAERRIADILASLFKEKGLSIEVVHTPSRAP